MNLDSTTVDNLVDELFAEITSQLCAGNDVAIPGFGKFTPEKTDEYIARDLTSGSTYLFPPRITVNFLPGTRLKKGGEQ